MCLRIRRLDGDRPVAKIATQPIYVAKILVVKFNRLDKTFALRSPYMSHVYTIGKTERVVPEKVTTRRDYNGVFEVDDGLHSYSADPETLRTLIRKAQHDYGEYVFIGLIPKGAKYYKGKHNGLVSYASSALRVLGRNDDRTLALLRT